MEKEKKPPLAEMTFQQVTFSYGEGERPLFQDLSFQVKPGFTALIGASGCGKSTVLKLVNGFLAPDTGRVMVNGVPAGDKRARCGYMPQHDLLFPWRKVLANVMLPMQIAKVPKKERRKKAEMLLTRVGLSGWGEKYPRELSGGMRQRVAFARTLATGADLLLLDEPFSALDSITRISMQDWLRAQQKEMEQTVLFVTHDVEEAIFLSGRILVLTGHPVQEVREIEVPLPAERTRDMLLKPEVEELKRHLVELLRQDAETVDMKEEAVS